MQHVNGNVFAVAAILARSLDKAHNSAGKLEHFYVVRWEGYGPEDDTWESYSNVAEGAQEFVRAFDGKRTSVMISTGRQAQHKGTQCFRGCCWIARGPRTICDSRSYDV